MPYMPGSECSVDMVCEAGEAVAYVGRRKQGLMQSFERDGAAVELSTAGGVVAKELNKALDTRHALAIKKFRAAHDEGALTALWREALANGDVAGAYWAVMTHPAATFELRTLAFGDVHMLSHLVGASNRADLRRVVALEEECERLKEANVRQQARLQELGVEHAAAVADMAVLASALKAQLERHGPVSSERLAQELAAELAQARAALAERDQKLALHSERRHDAEHKLLARQSQDAAQQSALQQAADAADAVRREAQGLELALMQTLEGRAQADGATLPGLRDKCVLYVGGRPGTTAMLAKLVAAAGGELLVHDGGIEDRRGLLAAVVPRAQLVVFPVDCVGHNAMQVAKQTCGRLGIACHPIRSASVASFVELVQRLHASEMVRLE